MKMSRFPQNGVWLKGNIHSHTTLSDGTFTPEELAKAYFESGYDFLSMTDHNLYVRHNEMPVEQLLLPAGIEHDIEYCPYKCIHVVGLGKAGKEAAGYPCRRYRPEEVTEQRLIDMMREDGQFVSIAHPVWSRMEPEELLALGGFHAMEVYNNGTEHLCHAGNAEVYWDLLLQHGKKVFATASDDVHGPDDLFGGWICAKVSERSIEALIDALFKGNFYASCGPVIYDFGMDGNGVYLSCSKCREIHFVTYPPKGASFFAENGVPLTAAFHPLRGGEAYVHAVCIDGNGKSAWTNPIFFDDRT